LNRAAGGLMLAVLGIWGIVQIWGGQALERLKVVST
jgi:hypothetical protein